MGRVPAAAKKWTVILLRSKRVEKAFNDGEPDPGGEFYCANRTVAANLVDALEQARKEAAQADGKEWRLQKLSKDWGPAPTSDEYRVVFVFEGHLEPYLWPFSSEALYG